VPGQGEKVSAATDFLNEWIQTAVQSAPSITLATCQRWPGIGLPFKPGIASYGWGIDGGVVRDQADLPVGLAFEVWVWFSDRGLLIDGPPPDIGQQFITENSDRQDLQFTIAGDDVQLQITLVSWGGFVITTSTQMFDQASQQLIFSAPGAGPNAPPCLLLVSFADTGLFGFE
jgi:hypothetical protein